MQQDDKKMEMSKEENKGKKHEFLKIDRPIPGQSYALVSFVEPTNLSLMSELETYLCSHFISWLCTELKNTYEWKSKNPDKEFSDEMKEKMNTEWENIKNMYSDWLKYRKDELLDKFNTIINKANEPVIRGFKVRGVYSLEEEARNEAKQLHFFEPAINIYIVPVGKWIPYAEDNTSVSTEYGHDKLNEIMKNRNVDLELKKLNFNERLENKQFKRKE